MWVDRWLRLGVAAWLVGSVLVWNLAFESFVRSAENRYLVMQSAPGAAPPPSGIRAIMHPAVATAARGATGWSLLPLLGGAALLTAVHWRRQPRSRAPRQADR